jgi:peptidoglycan hydrolase-like protein with peptidoglycan-binding domain
LAAVVTACLLFSALPHPASTVEAAPAGDEAVVAFLVRGVGNGHGRGLSQWGAYGRALAGQTWQQILAAYYGGTVSGTASRSDFRVRLTDWDGVSSLGVISVGARASWQGASTGASAAQYSSLRAIETAPNVFDVYGITDQRVCGGSNAPAVPTRVLTQGTSGSSAVQEMQALLRSFGFDPTYVDGDYGPMTAAQVAGFQQAEGLPVDGSRWDLDDWTAALERLAASVSSGWGAPLATGVVGPITFSTDVPAATSAVRDVLGLCEADGSITHYRGAIEFVNTYVGNRVVNRLDVEQYLRGVVPKEASAAWGDAGGGAGMNALRAQSVAARSYAMAQNRDYFVDAAKTTRYATTCDTSSCQVYGGAGGRLSAATLNTWTVETSNTDTAIADTSGTVRRWSGTNEIVSTEFSASNGPRTAGGVFAPADDPFDDQPDNPLHRWTRVIDADAVMAEYGLSSADGVRTEPDPASTYDGIWANRVSLGNGAKVSAWTFRNDFGLPSPGFDLIPIRRDVSGAGTFAFIGDSVGVSITSNPSTHLKDLTEGVFDSTWWSAADGRTTSYGASVAQNVPFGADLVVVELGYNDSPSAMAGRIDAVMTALRARDVGQVAWVNVSERRDGMSSYSSDYARTNDELAAAATRWDELIVLDWNAVSSTPSADRWFCRSSFGCNSDGVHLGASGRAEFALFLRDAIVDLLRDGYAPPRPLVPGSVLRVPVTGVAGVPGDAAGVSLNVTGVRAAERGFVRVWPCGSVEPETSLLNFQVGVASPNAVVVPVDSSGEVCVSANKAVDVIVDVAGWFESGVRSGSGDLRLVDTRYGVGPIPPR